jgi:hypothetical protein
MFFEPRDYLRHILIEADYLIGQSAAASAAEFMRNETLRRAFVPKSGNYWRIRKESP